MIFFEQKLSRPLLGVGLKTRNEAQIVIIMAFMDVVGKKFFLNQETAKNFQPH